jgi:hypothetical protein
MRASQPPNYYSTAYVTHRGKTDFQHVCDERIPDCQAAARGRLAEEKHLTAAIPATKSE